jgi:serine/threonine-protein kinase SRK2
LGTCAPHATQYVEREIVNHSNFVHPHVIQFKEVFLTPTHLAIAMEYAPGGDLFSFVSARGGLSEDDTRWFFQQLVIGLDYCHRMGVVNRDIKLENTLLDGAPNPLLKICDFGYSKHEADSRPKTKVGTPGYTAPEVVRAAASRRYDGRAADIWSAGVMLYTMLFCRYPFERPGDVEDKQRGFQKVLERILSVDYELPPAKPVSPECAHLLSRVLVADPAARATVAEIMAHPWFTKGLPPDAARMNDECLKLRPHEHPSYQTVEEIRAIVGEAGLLLGGVGGGPGGGAGGGAIDDEAIIEDVINDGADGPRGGGLDARLSSGLMDG